MPIISTGGYSAPGRFGNGDVANPINIGKAVQLSVVQDRSAGQVMAGVAGLGVVDLADTVASSIPGLSRALGQERGELNSSFLNAVDLPGLSDFYNDYKGGIEAASGVYGIVASELLTRRLTAPTAAFMGAMSKLPYVRRIAALDKQYESALQTVRAVDVNLASRGALGAEQYVGRTVVDSSLFDPVTGGLRYRRARD